MLWIAGECVGFSLEDEHREVKVAGETRIPAGTYRIKLRTEGGMHERYKKHYGARHKGMLWLQNVPGFTFIYIHPGNLPADTAGCILTGEGLSVLRGEFAAVNSKPAYFRIYDRLVEAIEDGEHTDIVVLDPKEESLK